MGEVDFLHDFQIRPLSVPNRRRRPLADAVHGHHRRVRKSRDVVRRCRMRLVMAGEEHRSLVPQFFFEILWNPEFFLHPFVHRAVVTQKSARPGRDVGRNNAVEELQQRLLVKSDGIDIVHRDTCVFQRVLDRVFRKRFVVLLAGVALFVRGKHNLTFPNQTRRAVVVVAGDAEDEARFRH